jgi:hypothetical protein
VKSAIARRAPGILTYGITPPKRSMSSERRAELAARQAARIRNLPIDGLVVYDLQDESDRTSDERPFPFIETVDPVEYAFADLASLDLPKVCYRCVAALTAPELSASLSRIDSEGGLCTLVGAASRRQRAHLKLSEAYALHRAEFVNLPLGGVLIAERHSPTQREDERVFHKQGLGCSFFVTQAVYSVVATKNVLSDLHYNARARGRPLPPVLVTLSPCGSLKTLEFMRWLGVSVPRWLANELDHAEDILETSLEQCTTILEDLLDFCAPKGIPLGCNVESVSIRREEIEASVELVTRVRRLLGSAPS